MTTTNTKRTFKIKNNEGTFNSRIIGKHQNKLL